MLKVTGIHKPSELLDFVDFDLYVPVSFKSYRGLVGGSRYVRLGDFKRHLLELQFPPDSMNLIGFTYVLGYNISAEQMVGDGPSVVGLPAFTLTSGMNFTENTQIHRLDNQEDIYLSVFVDRAEIRIGTRTTFNNRITYGRVEFLFQDFDLIGMRICNLNGEELEILNEYLERDPK